MSEETEHINRLDAIELIKQYYDEPIWNTKIGMCSPQVTNVDFETAIAEMDRCKKFNTENMEYVFIYATDYVSDAGKINNALFILNLGWGRSALNTKYFT